MANPQKENGHTQLSNEILEALYGSGLNGTELSVLLCVIRRTYGFHKKEDWISYTQFEKALQKARPNIWKAIESLVTKKQLVAKKQLGRTIYRFNKDYSSWVVAKTKLVTKKNKTSYEKEIQVVTKTQPTKETITKETIQKKGVVIFNFSHELLKHLKFEDRVDDDLLLENWPALTDDVLKKTFSRIVAWIQETGKPRLITTTRVLNWFEKSPPGKGGAEDDVPFWKLYPEI